jgi:hypothetical protein
MHVSGDFSGLQDFVDRLETGELSTLVIEYLTVDRASAGPGEDPQVQADAEIAVYAPAPAAD